MARRVHLLRIVMSSKARLGIEIVTREGYRGSIEAPEDVTSRPIVIGTAGDVLVDGDWVAPEHLLVHVDEYGRVLASSGHYDAPAFTEWGTIPCDAWIELPMPCNLLVGEIVVSLFWFIPRSRDPRRYITTERLERKPAPFFARLRAKLRQFAA
jgi:hypothetical protein